MPFPWLGWFGSVNAGRGDRRRNRRARQRNQPNDDSTREVPEVVAQRRQRRVGFGIGALLVLVVAGVVGFGYYKEFYKPPRVWAGSVSDVEFTMGDLVSRIRVLQGVNRYQGGQVNLSTVPFEYLQNLVHAEILRQQSPALGIAIEDENIEQELRRQFLPTAEPGQETDPGQLEREFEDTYGAYLTATGLSDADFRIIVEEQLAERGLALLLSQQIETEQPHVEIQWIQLPLDGDIQVQDVVRRLENEKFTRVAQELNTASQFSDGGGYVGWVPKGAFPDFDDVLYGNEQEGIEPTTSGLVAEPIFTNDSYFILNVLSQVEDRELTNLMGTKLLMESVDGWKRDALVKGTQSGTVRMNFNSRLYDWVTNQVFVTAPRIEQPTPVPEIMPGVPSVPGAGS